MQLSEKPILGKYTVIISLFSVVISLFSFLIAGGSFIRSCDNSNKIEELDFANKALVHRPVLKMVSQEIVKINIRELHAEHIMPMDPFDVWFVKCDSIAPNTPAHITLTIRAKFVNVGNSLAHILSIFDSDSSTDEPFVRNALLNSTTRNQFLNSARYIPVPYASTDLLPGDSMTIFYDRPLHVTSSSILTFHHCIYYFNENRALYDTYTWTVIDHATGIYLECNDQTGNGKISPSMLSKIIHQVSKYWNYSKDESAALGNFLEKNIPIREKILSDQSRLPITE